MSESERFVRALAEDALNKIPKLQLQSIESATRERIKDPTGLQLWDLYHKLDADEKKDFLAVIRQFKVDAISQVLGIIDNISFLEGIDFDFELRDLSSGEKLSGCLQDEFLGYVQEQDKML